MEISRKLWSFYARKSSLCSVLNRLVPGKDGFDTHLAWVRIVKRRLGMEVLELRCNENASEVLGNISFLQYLSEEGRLVLPSPVHK